MAPCAASRARILTRCGAGMDFQFNATADGRRLKLLNVINEHSRCLDIRVGRCCKAKDAVAVLEELNRLYLTPTYTRSDNGPEFNCFAEASWRCPRAHALVQGRQHQRCLDRRPGLAQLAFVRTHCFDGLRHPVKMNRPSRRTDSRLFYTFRDSVEPLPS